MRILIAFLLNCILFTSFAKNDSLLKSQNEDFIQLISPELTFPKGFVHNSKEAYQFLVEELDISYPFDLQLANENSSLHQNHYTFIETYKGIEIYRSFVKLNTLESGKITSQTHLLTFDEGEESEISSNVESFQARFSEPILIYQSRPVWVLHEQKLELVNYINYCDPSGYSFESLVNSNQEIIYEIERSEHFHDVDTVAMGYVFAPDPLTSANKSYGGSFIDNNNLSNPTIDAERLEVELQVLFNSTTQMFSLENAFVKITELSPPATLISTPLAPEFYFDRSQDGFEDVNVVYHITQQQQYIQSLGLLDLANYQIYVDAHGLSGDDNSLFNPSSNPPSLIFGTGGVDDAEDADVIIHEYGHAFMESAAPNTNFGLERNTIDEAFCDYLAASYSRLYEYWQDSWVYNWDGHNEFWNGRKVVSTAMYPSDLQNNQYKDAPMWSSALMRIERNIGRDATHLLALNAAYNYFGGITMPQAAQLILQQDSILFNGLYYGEVCYTFLDKGMVTSCEGSRPNPMVGIDRLDPLPYQIFNSEGFAAGTQNLRLRSEGTFSVDIYDLSGRLIKSFPTVTNEISLQPESFTTGVYVLKWTAKGEVKSVKITRF